MQTVVITPTYNEVDNLENLVHRVSSVLPDAMVLVVDDDSPDGTGSLADKLHEDSPERVTVLHRTQKAGLGAAYVAGYRFALQEWPDASRFVQMDADMSHDPSYLPALVAMADEADLVVASRYMNGISIVNWPLNRLIISKLGTAYARLLTGLPITDCTAGFKCYRREVLESINLESIRSNGYVFQVESSFRAWHQGFRLKDFPIIFYDRKQGQSKMSLGIAFEAFRVVLRLGLERFMRIGRSQNRQAVATVSRNLD